MDRTRAALLDATASCVERYGVRRTTMVDISSRGKVAKATLYNHFRTKDDVLAALVQAQVDRLAGEASALVREQGLEAALRHVGTALAASPPLRRVASDEPAVLAALAVPGDGRTWQAVRRAVADALEASGVPAGRPAVDVVVRWLSAQLLWPAGPEEAAAGAAVLAEGLRATMTAPSSSGQDTAEFAPAASA